MRLKTRNKVEEWLQPLTSGTLLKLQGSEIKELFETLKYRAALEKLREQQVKLQVPVQSRPFWSSVMSLLRPLWESVKFYENFFVKMSAFRINFHSWECSFCEIYIIAWLASMTFVKGYKRVFNVLKGSPNVKIVIQDYIKWRKRFYKPENVKYAQKPAQIIFHWRQPIT